jgi:hypothetical protein
MSNSQIILTNQHELSFTGDAYKGDGYYGFSDGLHTVSFHVDNFVGRIYLEATLVEQPEETDWFYIDLSPTTKYLEYSSQMTDTQGVSFTGNFVWVRAKVDRSFLTATTYNPSQHGRLDKVVLLR